MGTARNKHGPDVKIEKVPTETLFAPKITVCLVFLRLLLRLVNMSYQWFSVTLCYYGLSFASTNLSQHVWTDFLLRDPHYIHYRPVTYFTLLHSKSSFINSSSSYQLEEVDQEHLFRELKCIFILFYNSSNCRFISSKFVFARYFSDSTRN